MNNLQNKDNKLQVYIAGSLFSEAEQVQRKVEERYLTHQLKISRIKDCVSIFNPITNPFNDKSNLPTAEEIFLGDTKAIRESGYILLNLDNQLDAGVFVELGQIVGLTPEPHLVWRQSHTELRPHTEHQLQAEHQPQTEELIKTREDGTKAWTPKRLYLMEDSEIVETTSIKKKIYPVISDMRMGTAGEYDKERIPWGINTYVIGALKTYDPSITIYSSSEEAIRAMVEDLEKEIKGYGV